jgi:hypothetical protein
MEGQRQSVVLKWIWDNLDWLLDRNILDIMRQREQLGLEKESKKSHTTVLEYEEMNRTILKLIQYVTKGK